MHDIGLEEVERSGKQIDAQVASLGFTGTRAAFFEQIRADPQFYYARGDDMLRDYRDIAKRVDAELPRHFATLPRLPYGVRAIAFANYHRLPGDEPWRDNTLRPGELVTAIDLPAEDFTQNYTYLKLRDRLSYAFALVSVAVAMRLEGGTIAEARVALGGVAHKPWRRPDAEAQLQGVAPSPHAFGAFADALLAGAVGQGENDFKIPLARKAIVRALKQAADATPQSQTDKRVA